MCWAFYTFSSLPDSSFAIALKHKRRGSQEEQIRKCPDLKQKRKKTTTAALQSNLFHLKSKVA